MGEFNLFNTLMKYLSNQMDFLYITPEYGNIFVCYFIPGVVLTRYNEMRASHILQLVYFFTYGEFREAQCAYHLCLFVDIFYKDRRH